MSHKVGPFRVVNISPSTVTIDNDCISNTMSIHPVTLLPTLISVQDAMNDENTGNKDELPTGATGQNESSKKVIDELVNTKNRDSDKRVIDNDND